MHHKDLVHEELDLVGVDLADATVDIHKMQHAIIVGGSIAGLCAAIVLLSTGRKVTIYERNTSTKRLIEGAGIVAGPELLLFMEQFGVALPEAWTNATHARQSLDADGGIIQSSERTQRMSSWNLLYHLLRAKLDQLTPGDKCYLTGHLVTDLQVSSNPTSDSVPTGQVQVQISCPDGATIFAHADMVIAADGSTSTVRRKFSPSLGPQLVGYVAWRGTVPQTVLSTATQALLREKLTFFDAPGTQMVTYSIPAVSKQPGLNDEVNFVWYTYCPAGSDAYHRIMTDCKGISHHHTVSAGMLSPDVWAEQTALASRVLPSALAEVVALAGTPFVQAITEMLGPRAAWTGGRVVLVGEALASFRPHTGASTNQAALDALALHEWLTGEDDGAMGLQKFEEKTTRYAKEMFDVGRELGMHCQQELHG